MRGAVFFGPSLPLIGYISGYFKRRIGKQIESFMYTHIQRLDLCIFKEFGCQLTLDVRIRIPSF